MSTEVDITQKLSSGPEIPVLGLGTYPLDNAETEQIVLDALEVGYRLIDTAENYGNEAGVGRALRASDVARSDVFVTTKFNVNWHGREPVQQAFGNGAQLLQVDYIDLLLIHWPNPRQDRFVDAWRGLIELRDEGLVRAIGVSNFKEAHLQRLLDETGVAPDVNQIELNPYAGRAELRAFNAEHGIVTEAWAPLGKGGRLLAEPVITQIAGQHDRTPAQVILRWQLQLGNVAIPKTGNPERLRENFDVFGFSLDETEMNAISSLDLGDAGVTLDSDVFGH
jgi:2,5-diketo-D-gluconate reductase A